jgi:hypothetical protein
MTLLRHNYQVPSLGNCAMTLSTKIDLREEELVQDTEGVEWSFQGVYLACQLAV